MNFLKILILFSFSIAHADDSQTRLGLEDIFLKVPQVGIESVQSSFTKKTIVPWIGIVSSTLLAYQYDPEILSEIQRFGRKTGIGNGDKTKTVFKAGGIPMFRAPTDWGSTFYYLGDGWTHTMIATGLIVGGQLTESNRAWNSGIEILNGMITSTVLSQAIKRGTGRESPSEKTSRRGTWRPFPSIKAYGERTARYDAFPSGHIMTAMVTWTVVNANFPEYNNYTVPAAAVWLTLLGTQMVNNGVHWASDYPLGIAMGYVVGKAAVNLSKKPAADESASKYFVFPGIAQSTPTINMTYGF